MEQEKKYLKTIEEVSNALANGKIVLDNKPYILEPKPLEVKLWHLYENGRGEKVFIGYEHEDPYGEIEFAGLNKSIGMQIYRITGKNAYKGASDFDLVKELADLSGYFK